MNWVFSSLLMVFGSVSLYLTVRKSAILKLPSQFSNLAMFFVPLSIYLVLGNLNHISYTVTLPNLVLIIISAFFFAYFANVTSLRSIELAPNPGYSLVISKSYVVFTTLISVLFLGGELSPKKLFAILLIIIFSTLIVIDPTKTKSVQSNKWLAYTMYSFFGWGFLSLAIKYLSVQGMPTLAILTYLYIFVSLFIIIEKFYKKVKFSLDKTSLFYFLAMGIFSAIFNYFNFYAISITPNVGYVNAINASSISVVTVFSALLFKDDLTHRKMLGVIGVTVGLLLLIL